MDGLARQLEDTHDEIQRVRGSVVEALKAFYGTASALSAEEALDVASRWTPSAQFTGLETTTTTTTSDMEQRIFRLGNALRDVVGQLQLDTASADTQPRLVLSFAQRERLTRQMEQSKRMLQLVDKVTQLDNALFQVDATMEKGDVVGAAEAVVRAQRLLDVLDDRSDDAVDTDSDDILQVMRVQLAKKKNRVVHQLKQTHQRTVLSKAGVVRTKKPKLHALAMPQVSGIDAQRVLWQASQVMDMLQPRLKEIAKMVNESIFKLLFKDDAASVEISQTAEGVSLAIAEDATLRGRNEAEQIEKKCADVVAIIRFLQSEVMASDAELMKSLGDVLWKSPGNLEAQLLNFLQDKIPKDTTTVNAYRDVVAGVILEVERSLASLGFSAVKESRLHQFAEQINQLYAKKRRQELLTTARAIMGRDYRNSLQVTSATERCNIDASIGSGKKKDGSGGKSGTISGSATGSNDVEDVESGSFRMPDYYVTNCAHDIVELAHQTLIEACTSDPICANTLFQTSRDILFLFGAVVPTLYQGDIANDARTCMLYHNDCMYIAYHMLTIGHHYKSRLPSPLNQMATMVDMVPTFRDAGERALTAFTKSLMDELLGGLKTFAELGGVESESAMMDLEEFLKASLYKLNHINASWRGGLPDAVYNKVMGLVLEPVVASYLTRMLSESKISASAAGKLYTVTSLLLECELVFPGRAQCEKHVPTISKLRRFSQLLVQPLATVQDQYLSGDLGAFTPSELGTLVKSLFRDSPERREFLKALSSR